MSWMGAIPLLLDDENATSEETVEKLRAFADDLTVTASAHGFEVIPEPQDTESALIACNALSAALSAAQARYRDLTEAESQWN